MSHFITDNKYMQVKLEKVTGRGGAKKFKNKYKQTSVTFIIKKRSTKLFFFFFQIKTICLHIF